MKKIDFNMIPIGLATFAVVVSLGASNNTVDVSNLEKQVGEMEQQITTLQEEMVEIQETMIEEQAEIDVTQSELLRLADYTDEQFALHLDLFETVEKYITELNGILGKL